MTCRVAAGLVALDRVAVDGAVTRISVGRSGLALLTFDEHSHLDGARPAHR